MPSPSKKFRAGSALVRFISSLRPDRRSGAPGSLPVQTGFPTSLADLYVKNQSRLKKPSKKTKKKREKKESECVSTVGSSPEVCDLTTSPTPVVISSENVDEFVVEEEKLPPPVSSDDVSVCQRRNNSLGTVIVVLVNILALVLLAIFGKKLVVGFTAIVFFSWFLDSVRLDLVQFFKPCAEARSSLCLLEQRSFAIVSPILEVEIQTESDSIELEIQIESNKSRDFNEIWEDSPEFCEVQKRNSKKKSVLKRLFPKKHCKRKTKTKTKTKEKDEPLIDSIKCKEMEIASISEKEEDEIVNLVTEEESHEQEQQSTREIQIPPTQIMVGEISQSREIKEGICWFVVLLMVILFGLMEGKAIALILTIFCFISVSLIEFARRNASKERRLDQRCICN